MSNLSMLTTMRTWPGFFIFSGNLNGLNNYLNILSTHGEEEPELVTQMLSVLFTVIGMPTPTRLTSTTSTSSASLGTAGGAMVNKNNIYWNNCSHFISDISQSTVHSGRNQTNLLTTYLSLIIWSLINSKLPEILSSLMVSANADIAFLAKNLLQSIIHLSSVFVCMTDVTTVKTAHEAFLSFQPIKEDNVEDMRRKAQARNCFIDIGSTSTFLYPILESQTFVPSPLTDSFSHFSLFYCILDCYSEDTQANRELGLLEYICNQGVPFQSFIGKSFEEVLANKTFFMNQLAIVKVDMNRISISISISIFMCRHILINR